MAETFTFPDEQDDKPTDNEIESGSTEIEIEVVDDTPEKDRGRKPLDKEVADPAEDELDSYSDSVKKRIKELTHARHDERRAKEAILRERQELERVAQALLNENRQLRGHVNAGEQTFARTVQSATNAELEMAKKRYKEAYESGDADAVVAAQEALTEAKLHSQAAKNYRPTSLPEPEIPVQISQSATRAPQIDDKTLRWQAKNQWFGAPGNEDLTSYSLGLHQKLVNSGVDPRSDEYFEQIDARMRATFPDYFGVENKPKTGSGKPSTVVAPSSRSTASGKIKLTATQVALARKLGLTNQQYAMELAKLEK